MTVYLQDAHSTILQIYVKELNDVKRGCDSYDQAADWYGQEDSKAYVGYLQMHMRLIKYTQDCDVLPS